MTSPERQRQWRLRNPDRCRLVRRAWYLNNRTQKLKSNQKWKQDNADRYREQQSSYAVRRLSENLVLRLKNRLRSRICAALRRGIKSGSTQELIGCTILELRAHLEARFQSGMTWETWSRGGWHIDHIRPCASFDLTDPAQQRACFHYTNLQPLFAEENLRKHDTYVA